MINIFEIMNMVCSKIRDIAYNRVVFFNESIPNFLTVLVHKSFMADKSIAINSDKPITIESCHKLYTDIQKTPVYIGITNNINRVVVDTFTTMVDSGTSIVSNIICDISIGILLPKRLFSDEISLEESVGLLHTLYLELLNCDSNMRYEADFALLRFHSSKEINIPIYDIEMMILGICFTYLSLASMFMPTDENSDIGIDLITFGIPEDDLPKETLVRLERVIDTCCYGEDSIKTLRRSIGSGQLIKSFFIE